MSLNIVHPAQLQVYVAEDGGPTLRLADRSDGLRAFVALVAFLEAKNLTSPPILVLDEAENHLHWDAQADLITLFYLQDKVEQIIYSTHSPGCLPHDLGLGVRAVLPDPDAPHHSTVENWIWESSPGFRPLLLRMGASTAAMTPHRFAVMTEGLADFILLPSLLRDATGKEALKYQIVPGIAQATGNEIQQNRLGVGHSVLSCGWRCWRTRTCQEDTAGWCRINTHSFATRRCHSRRVGVSRDSARSYTGATPALGTRVVYSYLARFRS